MLLMPIALSLLFASCQSSSASKIDPQQSLFIQAPGSPIAMPGGAANLVIGDMNNDKKLDLVVASSTNRSVNVLLGKGDGQLTRAGTRAVSMPPTEIAAGDVNLDGNLDIALATHDSYGVLLLMGDGKGGFTDSTSTVIMKTGQHPHTHGLVIADMNRDNKLDLITVNNTDNDVSIQLGDGRGSFAPMTGSPFAVGPSPYPFGVGDVNGDGQPDIAATATATGPLRRQQLPLSHALTLLLSDGHGSLHPSTVPLRTGEPWFAVISDLNGDRKPDILVTHHEMNQLTVLIGDGRGGFVEESGSPFDFGHEVSHAAVVDLNRDGKNDVVATSGDGVRVMFGDGRGGFTPGPASPTGRGVWRLGIGDLNGDGKMDVVTSNDESGSVSVLLGR